MTEERKDTMSSPPPSALSMIDKNTLNSEAVASFPRRRVRLSSSAIGRIAHTIACALMLTAAADAQDRVFVNERWPIRDASVLSPPHVEPTDECSNSVYVDSFVPHATITVFLNGTTVIGGPVASVFGFADVQVSPTLHTGDKITARQTVNGFTSQPSAVMIVGKVPVTLPAPIIAPEIFACGQVVPVHNLTPGVTVEVRDLTVNTVIGNGATPNGWGSNWDPVVTSALVKGHQITARQTACTGVASPSAAAKTVAAEPAPFTAPTLDTPIIGNDAITAHGLFTGSLLKAFQGGPIGSGFSTGESNWMHVSPPIAATPGVTAEQDLCHYSPPTPPQTPTNQVSRPTLVAPICPGQPAAIVQNSTINATLVLLRNNATVGYGGAGPGDVPLDIASPAAFAQNDTVQVAEYIGNNAVLSNTVIVGGCNSTTTYHQDPQRTGWNASEKTLRPANVKPATFGLITNVPLDDRIDAQPLVVTNQSIEGQGIHTVVYIATEGNTVYAIDSWSGSILKTVSLGPPVSRGSCDDSGRNVGVNSTPTIDVARQTMYVVAYTPVGGLPTYRLHALDLSTLNDKPGSPRTVAASHQLSNGVTVTFNAAIQRQRSALLLSHGNIYVAFASFCDHHADQARGWLLGWNAATLNALPANKLTDTLATAPTPWFLSAIWMSGYGVAAEEDGDLFFVTGNSDPNGNTYTGTSNIQESVVKLSADLSTVLSLFTPANVFGLDQGDVDFGSGGVLVVPDQPGPVPKLAVAAGKDGRLFILDRSNLGGFHNPDIPKNVQIGGCWCGPSFYKGSDGVPRVVSSGGLQAKTWKINTALSTALQLEASGPVLPQVNPDPDSGFFTTVSSDGTSPNTALIWAIGRPTGTTNQIKLYAFDGTAAAGALPQRWSGPIDSWPGIDAGGKNMNLVPTVANGRVYAPGYNHLAIFGLKPAARAKGGAPLRQTSVAPSPLATSTPAPAGARYWGTITSVKGARIAVRLRTGKVLQVDLSESMKNGTTINPVVGKNVVINGAVNTSGILEASSMSRGGARAAWGPDNSGKR
jgi:hypothetical protein